MKKLKIAVVLMCVLCAMFCSSCGSREIESATIVRDDLRTGGSLSFVYDQKERIVYVGGDGEIIQYSEKNDSIGIDEGCRIGLKITAPDELLDLETASFEMNGVKYSSNEFLEKINGQLQRFFNIYPTVSENRKTVSFSITWQEGTAKQNYKLIVVDGTKFMDKNGEIT